MGLLGDALFFAGIVSVLNGVKKECSRKNSRDLGVQFRCYRCGGIDNDLLLDRDVMGSKCNSCGEEGCVSYETLGGHENYIKALRKLRFGEEHNASYCPPEPIRDTGPMTDRDFAILTCFSVVLLMILVFVFSSLSLGGTKNIGENKIGSTSIENSIDVDLCLRKWKEIESASISKDRHSASDPKASMITDACWKYYRKFGFAPTHLFELEQIDNRLAGCDKEYEWDRVGFSAKKKSFN